MSQTYHRDYYQKHREERLAYQRNYQRSCKEKGNARNREYRHKNKEKRLLWQRRAKAKKMLTLFALLGDKCSKCGDSDPRHLCFHHKNGGGTEDRKRFGRNNWWAMINYYLSHVDEAKEKLELLCANCHAELHSTFAPLMEEMKSLSSLHM